MVPNKLPTKGSTFEICYGYILDDGVSVASVRYDGAYYFEKPVVWS